MPAPALVSLIMAAYNAEQYIEEAIQSAIAQTYPHWELIIINDGSQDQTAQIVQKYLHDPRIQSHYQPNAGVSAARNRAFELMRGDFFQIFDSDDVLPPESLELRLRLFEHRPNLYFVDGIVVRSKDIRAGEVSEICTPSFKGNPHTALMCLDMRCFSVPAWLIRRDPQHKYQMQVGMTHGEDILFYIDISQNPTRLYDFVPQRVLYYRLHPQMAMHKLEQLERGYRDFYILLKKYYAPKWSIIWYLKYRITRIMFLSYLRKRDWTNAFFSVFRMLWIHN